MRVHFATVPVAGSAAGEEALNRFLAAHRVLSIDRHLSGGAWAICVTYVGRGTSSNGGSSSKKGPSVDYRDVLSPEDFAVYCRLRELRKELAQRDGVPAYAVLTNEQLATVVQERVDTFDKFGKTPGVGPARVEKYAQAFLQALSAALQEHGPKTPS